MNLKNKRLDTLFKNLVATVHRDLMDLHMTYIKETLTSLLQKSLSSLIQQLQMKKGLVRFAALL